MGLFEEFDASSVVHWTMEFDDMVPISLSEVSAPSDEIEVTEVKGMSATGKPFTRKIPGIAKAGEITLTRHSDSDEAFAKWFTEAKSRTSAMLARKGGKIVQRNHLGAPVKEIIFTGAFPKKWESSGFKASGADPATEKITVVYETIEIKKA